MLENERQVTNWNKNIHNTHFDQKKKKSIQGGERRYYPKNLKFAKHNH